jgi:hypothetical protein
MFIEAFFTAGQSLKHRRPELGVPDVAMINFVPNATPIRPSLRQATWQRLKMPSDATARTKLSGNQSGLFTTMQAPVAEILRTTQSIADAPNKICPAFKTRRREAERSWCILIPTLR